LIDDRNVQSCAGAVSETDVAVNWTFSRPQHTLTLLVHFPPRAILILSKNRRSVFWRYNRLCGHGTISQLSRKSWRWAKISIQI